MLTHEEMVEKMVKNNSKYKTICEALDLEFELLTARKAAGLTHDEAAERMGVKKSAIARLNPTRPRC